MAVDDATTLAEQDGVVPPNRDWDYGVSGSSRDMRLAEVLAAGLRAQAMSLPDEALDHVFTTEADVIQQSGLSRGTVREALRLLETEGTVTRKRGVNGGIKARTPDKQVVERSLVLLVAATGITVDEYLKFRLLVEPQAARLAAMNASDDDRERIRECAETEKGTPSGAAGLHDEIIAAAHIEVLSLIWESFSTLTQLETHIEPLSNNDWSAQQHAHDRIADAIRARDGDLAETYMRRHLEGIRNTLAAKNRLDQPLIPRSFWQTPAARKLFTVSER